MAKTTAPLLSFDARGQIAQTQVYATWKGRRYVRRYTIPANPRTAEQTKTRSLFTWLQNVYKYGDGYFTEAWQDYAIGKVMTAYNAFTKFNLPPLRGETTLANFVFSPSARSGIAPAAVVATGGVGQISVAVTAPASLPAGWTNDQATASAILDQNPQTATAYQTYTGYDVSDPYTIVLTGLPAGDYIVGGWMSQIRPDGKLALSAALTDTATVT